MNIMRQLVTLVILMVMWAAGKLRVPIAATAGFYTAFGSSMFQQQWNNPGPWRTTASILAAWATYEVCSLIRTGLAAAWENLRAESEMAEIIEPPF